MLKICTFLSKVVTIQGFFLQLSDPETAFSLLTVIATMSTVLIQLQQVIANNMLHAPGLEEEYIHRVSLALQIRGVRVG